jgi:hypothetical protein
MLIAAAYGGYQMWGAHRTAHALRTVLASSDVNGFIDVPQPSNQDADTIYVVAAQNCPHADAQRADQLAKDLGAQGMPVKRSNEVFFHAQAVDRATMDRLSVVMQGPLPLVFVHGRVAPNPELSQVVEEFTRPGSTHPPQ